MRAYVGGETTNKPLYPFGFGLSYSQFEYKNLTIDKKQISKAESVNVSVQVTNTGKKAGEEIVQLYIRDKVSSGTRPEKELKDFARVNLQLGETKTVTFTVTPDKLEYYNTDLNKVIEPGDFDVMVGSNSEELKTVSFSVL
jgi:CARDB.